MTKEWPEYSMLYMEFLVAIAMYNRFHPKFSRTAPEQFQLQIADRLLLLLSFPNLLLTPGIEWTLDVQLIPTPVRGLPGYQSFRFDDKPARDKLKLPVLEEGDGWELHLLATGPYTPRRANGALCITREAELMGERRAGKLGSLTNYNDLAAMLPQSSPIYYFIQADKPNGYDEGVFGSWPSGDVIILKVSIASSHKTPTNKSNMHTVTLAFAKNPPDINPLRLQGHLSALLAHACTCKSGSGTNRACAHILATLIGLCCPSLFRTPKKKSSRISDIHKPADHQPTMPGLCSTRRKRPATPAPAPPRRTQDCRQKLNKLIFLNYSTSGSTTVLFSHIKGLVECSLCMCMV